MNATVPTPTTLAPGSFLERYELLAMIAEGGFGQVWLARLRGKRGFEKLVAIKVARPTGDVAFQEMLLDEARIASAIHHENVAQVLELGEQGDILYIVMEWIDGEPLSAVLRTIERNNVALPLAMALRVVAETCAAAHAAHELCNAEGALLGVVHRDISPQNILITSSGRVKLIDFGIVKAKDRAIGATTDGTLKGKLKYMAPEQALGKDVDRRSDIFALGAVLFRLITGVAPYEGENDVVTLQRLVNGKSAPIPSNVPLAIRRILEKALQRSPDARFSTALEMEHALSSAMATLNLMAEPSEIAAFVDANLHERMANRQQTIESALKAAAERSAIQQLRPMSGEDSRSVQRRGDVSGSVQQQSASNTPPGVEMSGNTRPSALLRQAGVVRKRWGLVLTFFCLGLLATSVVVLALRLGPKGEEATSSAPPPPASALPAAASATAVPPSSDVVLELVETPSRPDAPAAPAASGPTGATGWKARPGPALKAKPQAGSPTAAPSDTADFGY